MATIAKRCGMSAAAVKERLGAGAGGAAAKPAATSGEKTTEKPAEKSAAKSAEKPAPTAATRSAATPAATTAANAAKPAGKAPAEPLKLPPGTVLELCGCYGSMEYGFTEPNAQCVSGKAVATRCPGYCPVNRSPWRRICS
ncbi:hypothetical protein [Achromobacter spanius]|uniref:hypothetical protein n=1 Tax=Achromobacter spanius TaxID=217203 RepID=UPI00381A1DC1